MNSKILTIAAVAAALTAASCDNWTPPVDGAKGTVDLTSVNLSNSDAVTIHETKAGRADETDIDLTDYVIRVYKAGDTSAPVNTWAYGSMPEVISLTAGTYVIDVESHAVAKAEWEHPFFKGASESFAVEAGKITKVGNIECRFKSIRVTIEYDDEVRATLGDDVKITVKANDEGSLVFTPAETRSGYYAFVENSTTMAIHFEGTVNGSFIKNSFTFEDLAPGQHRIIRFSKKNAPTPPDQTGQVDPGKIGIDISTIGKDIEGNVTVDEETQTLVDPWQEEPEEDPKPDDPVTEPAATFTSDNLDLKGVNDPEQKMGGASVNISCPKGIAHLNVSIISDALTPALPDIGLTSHFDLAYPGEIESALKEDIGLPVGDEVINQTAVVFDITKFMGPLSGFSGDHSFELEVIDNEGQTSNLTLKFHAN